MRSIVLDVRIVNGNTQIRVSDVISENSGFGTGELLLNPIATGFTEADINTKVDATNRFTFVFS
ncbi:MAG: hypothetical protein ACRC62_25325 [Microcoleus sp.]